MIHVWSADSHPSSPAFVETDMPHDAAQALLAPLATTGGGIVASAEAIEWRRDDAIEPEWIAWFGWEGRLGLFALDHLDSDARAAWANVPADLTERVFAWVERTLENRDAASEARKLLADARVASTLKESALMRRTEIVYGAENDSAPDDVDQRTGEGR